MNRNHELLLGASSVCGSGAELRHDSDTARWIDSIQAFRFPLAVAVVGVHSCAYILDRCTATASGTACSASGPEEWLIRFLMLICQVATSTFLLAAGFLFFRDGPVSWARYREKLRARCFTLLLPYLAWNFLALLVFSSPAVGKYFFLGQPPESAAALTVGSVAKAFLGWPLYPANAPLWFVRDLILFVAAAPLFNLIPRRLLPWGLVALCAYWLIGPAGFLPGGIPRSFSLLFFALGAWMGIRRVSLKPTPSTRPLLWLAAATLLISAALGATFAPTNPEVQLLCDKIVRVSGTLALVLAATLPLPDAPPWRMFRSLSAASFFLFASHFCVLFLISVAVGHALPYASHNSADLLLLGLVWSGTVTFSLAAYFLMRRHAPSLLSALDGKRSLRFAGRNPAGKAAAPAAGLAPAQNCPLSISREAGI